MRNDGAAHDGNYHGVPLIDCSIAASIRRRQPLYASIVMFTKIIALEGLSIAAPYATMLLYFVKGADNGYAQSSLFYRG